MILTLIVLICLWMGFMFNLFPYILPIPIIKDLPFWIISCIWFTIGIILIVYRGYSSGYWKFIDFPVKGQVKAFNIDKINIIPQILLKSKIDGLIKTPDGTKFYRDRRSKATLFSAGHECRIVKDGVNHTLSPDDLILTQRLNEMGIHNINEMDGKILEEMVMLREDIKDPDELDKYGIVVKKGGKRTIYTLTGTDKPETQINIEGDPWHKHVFDEICKKWGWLLADGEVVTVFQYNEFQRDLARSDDMASAIDYVRTTEAGKALKIKKGQKSSWLIWVIIAAVAIVLILVAIYFMTGGQIPGMTPKA